MVNEERAAGKAVRFYLLLPNPLIFVCRYGGDEFILILPGASLATTKKRAEYLSDEVRNLVQENEGLFREEITLSMSVAVYPEHGTTCEEVFRAADTALYRSKERGRNCVKLAGA